MLPKPIGFGAKAWRYSSLVALWLAALPTIAATIGPSGYTNAFSIQPPAADWATLSIGGVGQDTYDPDTQMNATMANSGSA
jgi:hypothetical protein